MKDRKINNSSGIPCLSVWEFYSCRSPQNSMVCVLRIKMSSPTNLYWGCELGACMRYTASADAPVGYICRLQHSVPSPNAYIAYSGMGDDDIKISHPFPIYWWYHVCRLDINLTLFPIELSSYTETKHQSFFLPQLNGFAGILLFSRVTSHQLIWSLVHLNGVDETYKPAVRRKITMIGWTKSRKTKYKTLGGDSLIRWCRSVFGQKWPYTHKNWWWTRGINTKSSTQTYNK